LLVEVQPRLEAIGDLLVRDEHYDEAISAYEAAQRWVERNEGDDRESLATLLAKRAWCHVELGQGELACRLYERALRLEQATERADQEFIRNASEYLEENCR
jgi:tetratricopeptide (TPR) repeat protein